MIEGSGFRRHLAVLLFCLPLGVFVGDVIASAPPPSIDLARTARIVLAQAKGLIKTRGTADVPLPTTGTSSRSFRSPWVNEREYGNSETTNSRWRSASELSVQNNAGTASALKGGTVNMLLSGLPEVAGRISALHGVSPSGAGTYSIPLWTPPGARGIEPKLSLNYASGTPDWLMGPGWRLGGLSVISRCPNTIAQNGYFIGVKLMSSDKFCLDGNQLVLTSGTYGAANSTYQTEIDTFSRVTALGTAGNGPQRFEVYGKDGLIYEYGNTTDSRVYGISGTTPYAWALNKVRDRQGNNMVIAYTQSDGSHRPDTISYTQTPATSFAYNYQVTFTYAARSAVATLNEYVDANKVAQTKVLTTITVQATVPVSGTVTVRQYNIDYATSPTTLRPRVAAVQECSASDCLRPTTIAYQDGATGMAAVTTSAGTGTVQNNYKALDIDGDGRDDLVYSTLSGSTLTWYAKFATGGGFSSAVALGLTTASSARVLFDDFLGEGRITLLTVQSGVWNLTRWNGSTFTTTSTGLASVATYSVPASVDIDGDGKAEIVFINPVDRWIYANYNTSTGVTPSFSSANLVWDQGQASIVMGNNDNSATPTQYLDVNGDGRGDVIALATLYGYGAFPYKVSLISDGYGFPQFAFAGDRPLNFNNDACTDFIVGTNVQVSACTGSAAQTIAIGGTVTLVADWDGDGRDDIWTTSGGVYQVRRSQGDSLATSVSTGITAPATAVQVFDQDGDGLHDLVTNNSGLYYGLHSSPGVQPDLATSFTDGYDMAVAFDYKSIFSASGCYVRDLPGPASPDVVFTGTLYTACSMSASDGIGGTYQVNHTYYNANVNLLGRGFLGFQRHQRIDNRDSIVNIDTYSQSYPYIGLITASVSYQPGGITKIREVANTLSAVVTGARRFPYVSQSVEDAYEVGGALNGAWVTRTTTSTSVDSYGNPTIVTVASTDKQSTSPYVNETFTVQTVNTITNDTGANWCLGRPNTTTVQSTLPSASSQTRTKSFSVDYANCRNTQEVVEPASSTLKVTTDYGFDTCGNVNSVTVTGKDPSGSNMAARTTSSSYGGRCQFPESVTNALSQTTVVTYDYGLGVPTSNTDPNGIAMNWVYDGYGRKTQENRPDGTYTTFTYGFCDSSNSYCGGPSDLRSLYLARDKAVGGADIRVQYLLEDGYGRVRFDQRTNFGGGLSTVVTGYDTRGNEIWRYNPHSSFSNGYKAFAYDLLNRPTTTELYDGSGVFDRQVNIAYQGRATLFTDAKGNVTTKYLDVNGHLRRVVDPSPGGTTEYTYDHFGNLLSATDVVGSVMSSTYNLRGFKTASNDPDAGNWVYSTNSLGEVVSQTDAKSQTTTFDYDPLGRMTARTEAEGTSNWTWGNSAGLKNIGRLFSISGPGYSENYSYDSIGRPASTDYAADTSYQVNYAYDSASGFLDNVTYPTSTSGYRLRVQYQYQNGFLRQVRDYNAPATVWWQMNAQDDRANPVDEQFANGVHALSNYDGPTGALNWRTSGNNGSYDNYQNISYEWDKNDNLDKRIDVNQSNLTERFYYDALDRLDYSTLNGSTNLDVTLDAAGNITQKSDVGNYTYHATRKHAVSSTSNGWSFTYDNNGNMITGRGNTMSWYSYNLPNTLSDGTRSSQFFYTPDRKYWKQDAVFSGGTESTVYIGGLLEKVTSAAGTDYRHMIKAGTATVIISRHTTGVNNTYYVTQDSLGSSAAVTNSAGALLVVQNFDAYGKRRGNTGWTGNPSAGDWTGINSTSRRGYTDHTMVDTLNYVHMNGRMYDPTIGRFLSPDPIIQDIAASQSLNPYSYVWNNPLKYTDPSGFGLKEIWQDFKGGVAAAWDAVTGFFINTRNWIGGWFTDEDATQMGGSQNGVIVNGELIVPGERIQPKPPSGAGIGGATQVQLTEGDVWQSFFAGTGNSIASGANFFVNLMISIGDINGDAALVGPWRPFEPSSHYFGNEGEAVGDGLQAVWGARGLGKGFGEGFGTSGILKGPLFDAIPANLPQQLALGAARAGEGTVIMRNLGDAPRLIANYGPGEWVKMQYVLRGTDSNVTVHYFRNLTINKDVEFKFP